MKSTFTVILNLIMHVVRLLKNFKHSVTKKCKKIKLTILEGRSQLWPRQQYDFAAVRHVPWVFQQSYLSFI